MRSAAVVVVSLSLAVLAVLAGGCAAERPIERKPVVEAPPPPDHPRTWAEVPEWYGSKCPPPAFVLDTPHEKSVGGVGWTVRGTTAARAGRWSGPLTIGVLGAIKDAAPDTRKNLEKARAAFDKARVDVVLCNGDVAETAEISEVARMLGDVFGSERPILVHSGNSEWTGGFNQAFFEAEQQNPAFFNLNYIRDLDLGGVHLVSLPGWSVKQFVKEGGCRYRSDDVAAVAALVDGIRARDELVVLTAHGPPRGPDKKSLDATHDFGNVGDEDLAKLLQGGAVRFGIFGHILEAGGRATDDPVTQKALPLPMKKPAKSLFINVGSASSIGIEMLDKKTSRGMAAIVVIDAIDAGGTGKVTFLPLRK